MEKVAIIGLGYVGLPVACLCIKKGFSVIGADIDTKKITALKEGKSPIDDPYLNEEIPKTKGKLQLFSKTEDAARLASIIVVCVPTPVDDNHKPDLKPLENACKDLAKGLQKNALIIIESTIFPGTVEEIVKPIIDKAKVPYLLAHCPERIDPGNKKYQISNIPRVVAGIDEQSTKRAAEFYRKILDANVVELSSVKAAEATKIMENTFRDINIAFVNEMAMSFDKAGIDIMEVIKGASTKPFAFMPHYPGAGVGGHCIPVDPYYLIEKAKSIGFSHRFLSLAREINNNMPHYTIELLENELKKINKKLEGTKVGVLGLAYKKNVDDMRESPALEVIDILKKKKALVEVFDPYVKDRSTVKGFDELMKKSECIVLVTDHDVFVKEPLETYKKNDIKVIIDGRNCLDKEKIMKLGIAYHGIGRF